jgi:hypothetical protein
MVGAGNPAVRAWVVPQALELDDLYALARLKYDAPRSNRPHACGIVGALMWGNGECYGRAGDGQTIAASHRSSGQSRVLGDKSRGDRQHNPRVAAEGDLR